MALYGIGIKLISDQNRKDTFSFCSHKKQEAKVILSLQMIGHLALMVKVIQILVKIKEDPKNQPNSFTMINRLEWI